MMSDTQERYESMLLRSNTITTESGSNAPDFFLSFVGSLAQVELEYRLCSRDPCLNSLVLFSNIEPHQIPSC